MPTDREQQVFESLELIEQAIPSCSKCPELRSYCAKIARKKRKAYADETYWGKPVPGFGDRQASIMIIGLAPAAHGANRTGRMFTGDRSGDFLYAALARAGLANQPTSTDRDDGLKLRNVYIAAPLRCAPPGNKPTREQLDRCRPFLANEFRLLDPRVILCLGSIAWREAIEMLRGAGIAIPRPRPRFGHGATCALGGGTTDAVAGHATETVDVLGSYHVSQQNTFTGRLTPVMLDRVLEEAKALAGIAG